MATITTKKVSLNQLYASSPALNFSNIKFNANNDSLIKLGKAFGMLRIEALKETRKIVVEEIK